MGDLAELDRHDLLQLYRSKEIDDPDIGPIIVEMERRGIDY
jgi:hypothetical protein